MFRESEQLSSVFVHDSQDQQEQTGFPLSRKKMLNVTSATWFQTPEFACAKLNLPASVHPFRQTANHFDTR